MPRKTTSDRVYAPFPAWILTGESEHRKRWDGSSMDLTSAQLPLGEPVRDERSIASGGGLCSYGSALSAVLHQSEAGPVIVRLECVGPASRTLCNRVRQRTALWQADASGALHEFAIWCVEQKLATLKSASTIREWEQWLGKKRASLAPDCPTGFGRVPWHVDADGEFKWTEEHKILTPLCGGWPIRCVRQVWEAVRLALPKTGWRSGREKFIADSREWLEARMLSLEPKEGVNHSLEVPAL